MPTDCQLLADNRCSTRVRRDLAGTRHGDIRNPEQDVISLDRLGIGSRRAEVPCGHSGAGAAVTREPQLVAVKLLRWR